MSTKGSLDFPTPRNFTIISFYGLKIIVAHCAAADKRYGISIETEMAVADPGFLQGGGGGGGGWGSRVAELSRAAGSLVKCYTWLTLARLSRAKI